MSNTDTVRNKLFVGVLSVVAIHDGPWRTPCARQESMMSNTGTVRNKLFVGVSAVAIHE